MALDNFTSDDSGQDSEEEEDYEMPDTLSNEEFEEEYGKPPQEALHDEEIIAELIEEGRDTAWFCSQFSIIEHTAVHVYAKAVRLGEVELSEVPDVDHPEYRDKHGKYYVKRAVNNKSLTKAASGSSSSSSSRSSGSSSGSSSGGTGLDAFKS